MSVVAISDTAGSLGAEIAHAVAATLGYELADREIISKTAERFGEGVVDLRHATEEKPTLWERFTETQRRYMTYIEAIVLELAARDNVVLVGRASTAILSRVPQVLRVRISAPETIRARRVEQQQGLTQEAALDSVRHSDHERAARVKFLYHVDWEAPLLYDLVLNTERLGIDRAAQLIRETLDDERFQTGVTTWKTVHDLSLAAQVRAAILANPTTRPRQIFVSCTDGHIILSGTVHREEERRTARDLAAGLAGVSNVQNDIIAFAPTLSRVRGV